MCKKVIKMGKHGPTDEWIKETNDKWFAHKAAVEKGLEDGPAPALVLATVSAPVTATVTALVLATVSAPVTVSVPVTAPVPVTVSVPATVSVPTWSWLWKTSKIEK